MLLDNSKALLDPRPPTPPPTVLTTPFLALALLVPGGVTASAADATSERAAASDQLLAAIELSRSLREGDLVGIAPLIAGSRAAADTLGAESYTEIGRASCRERV